MFAQDWSIVAYALFVYGPLVVAPLIFWTIRNAGKGQRMDDDEKLDKRRLQGGVYFNEILHDMRGDLERLKAQCLTEMIDGESKDARKLAAERVEFCDRNLGRIARMLNMREAGND
jgi:hypothetical protein